MIIYSTESKIAKANPLLKAERVTIVVGFNFGDGVLICADTKHSGKANQFRTKLHTKEYPSGSKSVFAIAGRTHFARMAVEECEQALASISDPTLQDMEDRIVEVLVEVHRKHIFPHPAKGYEGGPDFNLLIGLWSPHDKQRLYRTDETALDRVPTYDCLGTGEYLARYIIDPRYAGPQLEFKQVLFTAITALGRIKKYDPNCGGKSEFVVLRRNGEMAHETEFDISQGEKFSDTFFNLATAVYTMIADYPLTDEQVKQHITWFLEAVNDARGSLQTEKDYRDSLRRALSSPQNKGQ